MMALVSIIKAVCLIVLLFCTMLGTFGSQLQPLDDNSDAQIFLYKIISSAGTTVYYTDYSYGCGALDSTFNAAFSFALLSWVAILAGVVVAIIAVFNRDLIPSIVCLVVAVATWVFLTISCSLIVALFFTKYCGASEAFNSNSRYDYGFGFLVLSWIITTCWVAFEALSFLKLIPAVAQQGAIQDQEKPTTTSAA
eukprot:GFYU01021661.1.p1 GENE.GFYU01021661.1~~GFYU01021661.1.p1  ORF type:complete len:210 (-),score=24.61 GFYU01021661.1:260-844(-)